MYLDLPSFNPSGKPMSTEGHHTFTVSRCVYNRNNHKVIVESQDETNKQFTQYFNYDDENARQRFANFVGFATGDHSLKGMELDDLVGMVYEADLVMSEPTADGKTYLNMRNVAPYSPEPATASSMLAGIDD